MVSFSQHPDFSHTLLHISDTHLLSGGKKLYKTIEGEGLLRSFLERVVASGLSIDALVFTGDLADRGEAEAYQRLHDVVTPFASALQAQVVWVMGNHDEIPAYSRVLFGGADTLQPQDRVYDVRGLRIISLDTSVPGYHHGEITAEQLAWLERELSTPAEHGTLLALHHPPIPTPIALMGLIELDNQSELEALVRDSDVRGVLAGHLHYATFSQFAGVPISVAPAACYNIDLIAPAGHTLSSKQTGLGGSLVNIYPDHVVFSSLPFDDEDEFSSFTNEQVDTILPMTPEQRRAMFSDKTSEFNRQVDEAQAGA